MFACHIQHFKYIKEIFFVSGQFSMQCILIRWYLLTFICDGDTFERSRKYPSFNLTGEKGEKLEEMY